MKDCGSMADTTEEVSDDMPTGLLTMENGRMD